MENVSKQQIEQDAHRQAYALLCKLIDSQPNLFSAAFPNLENGQAVGQHLNGLYDQLVVLSRKSIAGEYGLS